MSDIILKLSDLINMGKNNKISLANVSITKNGILEPVYLDYLEDIRKECIDVELTEDEFVLYRRKPRKLADDVYSNSEYFHIILLVNNMKGIHDFTKKNITLLSPQSDIIYDILKNEKNNLDRYDSSKL